MRNIELRNHVRLRRNFSRRFNNMAHLGSSWSYLRLYLFSQLSAFQLRFLFHRFIKATNCWNWNNYSNNSVRTSSCLSPACRSSKSAFFFSISWCCLLIKLSCSITSDSSWACEQSLNITLLRHGVINTPCLNVSKSTVFIWNTKVKLIVYAVLLHIILFVGQFVIGQLMRARMPWKHIAMFLYQVSQVWRTQRVQCSGNKYTLKIPV